MTALPDDVSVSTANRFGATLEQSWHLWSQWNCLVGALQQAVAVPADSPIAHTGSDAGEYFQASIYNVLVGHYRLAFTSLRAVVENMTIGAQLELSHDTTRFHDWLNGQELKFGWAADVIVQHANVKTLETALSAGVSDDLFRQKSGAIGTAGLARRLFWNLSKYAHGAPGHNDADMWQSNGPVFVSHIFETWTTAFVTVFALAILQARLAQPKLQTLPWGANSDARGLFEDVIRQLPNGDARALFESVPSATW